MLEELKISRFKSVRDQTLDLGRVNLFIGGNGAGKSNLLEAIGLTSACLGRGLGDSEIGAKGLRISPPERMKSSFKNGELPKTLELIAKFTEDVEYTAALQGKANSPHLQFSSEKLTFKGENLFSRSSSSAKIKGFSHTNRLDKSRGIWDQIKATADIPPEVDKAIAEFSRYVIYAPQTSFLRGQQSGRVDVPPVGLHGEGLAEAVTSFFDKLSSLSRKTGKKGKANGKNRMGSNGTNDVEWEIINYCADLIWLPGWAYAVGVRRGKASLTSRDMADRSSKTVHFHDRFMHTGHNDLSVYDSSEGTLFLLFMAIILAHPEAPRTFALDNVDNALNPTLNRRLIDQITEVTRTTGRHEATLGAQQVFLTSHNPTTLDAFDLFDQDQRVFVVSRNERGHTIAKRLKPKKGMTRADWSIAKNGRNLSQLWMDGAIRGALGELQ